MWNEPTDRVKDEHGIVHLLYAPMRSHTFKCSWVHPKPLAYDPAKHVLMEDDTVVTCLFCCRVPHQ